MTKKIDIIKLVDESNRSQSEHLKNLSARSSFLEENLQKCHTRIN